LFTSSAVRDLIHFLILYYTIHNSIFSESYPPYFQPVVYEFIAASPNSRIEQLTLTRPTSAERNDASRINSFSSKSNPVSLGPNVSDNSSPPVSNRQTASDEIQKKRQFNSQAPAPQNNFQQPGFQPNQNNNNYNKNGNFNPLNGQRNPQSQNFNNQNQQSQNRPINQQQLFSTPNYNNQSPQPNYNNQSPQPNYNNQPAPQNYNNQSPPQYAQNPNYQQTQFSQPQRPNNQVPPVNRIHQSTQKFASYKPINEFASSLFKVMK
jgi:hypothetical protein